jgi:hypothetical protein
MDSRICVYGYVSDWVEVPFLLSHNMKQDVVQLGRIYRPTLRRDACAGCIYWDLIESRDHCHKRLVRTRDCCAHACNC